MRIGIIGSKTLPDSLPYWKVVDNFFKEFSIKNPTVVLENSGTVSEEVVKFTYSRGYDTIALPVNNLNDIDAFIANTDRIICFIDKDDKYLISFQKRARRKHVQVMLIDEFYTI